ncbi:hypothetical protein CPT_Sansa86 [Caulobacter phage Sansa]|uniref:Uncharacterized protein n=1 Tax=Caulobacter phage Sansa TaxID=1675600 RepID=A0A0K1LMY9_9CAUD|nr:hypothetical protein HOR07_gp086 [Caulobacter phage Sansa]AKU43490.1 hypothetical protein CPT_Sansa86 [Caulobacter phage Sansa]
MPRPENTKRLRFMRTIETGLTGREALIRAEVIMLVSADYDGSAAAIAIDIGDMKAPKIDLVPMPDWFELLGHGLALVGDEELAAETATLCDDMDEVERGLNAPKLPDVIQNVLDGKVSLKPKDRLLGSSGMSVKQ